ncbi:hypothetical protein D8B26_004311 [Coccidioides posadasii str. Silveira]|uniref:uncharacterized protein n=1 Tax=Coccidioides posadasii (strain RMSCC 757 / Silveira) TaxID=443226 RepID=UPI001BED55B4|nr:hypothetical protein D8B26_004311 [Coccidioides posadasii str. Silveira]
MVFYQLLLFLVLWTCYGSAASVTKQRGPVFKPSSNGHSSNNIIECSYPDMHGWVHDKFDKRNWLKWVGKGPAPEPREYGVATDYEKYTPKGITRKVGFL